MTKLLTTTSLPYFLVIALLFTFSDNMKGQVNNQTQNEVTIQRKALADEGTFILSKRGKVQEVLTKKRYEEIRALVAQNRASTTEKRITLSKYTDVIIPPFSVINDPNFKPFTTLFIQ